LHFGQVSACDSSTLQGLQAQLGGETSALNPALMLAASDALLKWSGGANSGGEKIDAVALQQLKRCVQLAEETAQGIDATGEARGFCDGSFANAYRTRHTSPHSCSFHALSHATPLQLLLPTLALTMKQRWRIAPSRVSLPE
jgi:hypothetical protein